MRRAVKTLASKSRWRYRDVFSKRDNMETENNQRKIAGVTSDVQNHACIGNYLSRFEKRVTGASHDNNVAAISGGEFKVRMAGRVSLPIILGARISTTVPPSFFTASRSSIHAVASQRCPGFAPMRINEQVRLSL